MRILHTVEFYEPRKGGAERVVKELSESLVRAGHEVTVATTNHPDRIPGYVNGVRVVGFDIEGNLVGGIKQAPGEVKRYRDLLHSDFDVILNYAAQNWTTDLALEELKTIKAKLVLVPCGYSGLRNKKYTGYFKELPAYLSDYDALVYMSENYQDFKFGQEQGLAERAVYIPNGADEQEFYESKENGVNFRREFKIKTKYLAISVSNHYIKKGHGFVLKAFKAMKRRDTTLVIIGEKYVSSGAKTYVHLLLDYFRCKISSLLNPRIKLITSGDREVATAAYRSADIFLFGSEVECAPLVTYEAFASHTPFVTRSVGNVSDHKDYLKIIHTPYQMAKVANDILDNPDSAKMISEKAYVYYQKITSGVNLLISTNNFIKN